VIPNPATPPVDHIRGSRSDTADYTGLPPAGERSPDTQDIYRPDRGREHQAGQESDEEQPQLTHLPIRVGTPDSIRNGLSARFGAFDNSGQLIHSELQLVQFLIHSH